MAAGLLAESNGRSDRWLSMVHPAWRKPTLSTGTSARFLYYGFLLVVRDQSVPKNGKKLRRSHMIAELIDWSCLKLS